MNRILLFFLGIILISMIHGCNTIHGLGKDIEKGGEAIQKSVK